MTQMASPVLRVARPTDQLQEVVEFYRYGLGFKVLADFKDHDGFDGVILGHSKMPWHLEFTHKTGHVAGRAPTEDNLIVLYLPESDDWTRTTEVLEKRGIKPVRSFNPYWDKNGKTYEDPDGYRVVLQNAAWEL